VVTIEGLQRAAEHNGQPAAVLSLTSSGRGRFTVELLDGGRQRLLAIQTPSNCSWGPRTVHCSTHPYKKEYEVV
jgi:hypothetical protein